MERIYEKMGVLFWFMTDNEPIESFEKRMVSFIESVDLDGPNTESVAYFVLIGVNTSGSAPRYSILKFGDSDLSSISDDWLQSEMEYSYIHADTWYEVFKLAAAIMSNEDVPECEDEHDLMLFIDKDIVYIDDKPLYNITVPRIYHDRTFLPLRFIAGLYEADVGWDEKTQTASLVKGATIVKIVIGANDYTLNDKTNPLDAPAFIDPGTGQVLAPVRFIAEAFNTSVTWDVSEKSVRMSKNGSQLLLS
jgi:hypothetical protein